MQDDSQDRFQIATLVVTTITALVVIFDLLVFLNPRVAFNPFKPPLPSPTLLAAATLSPPTWTPVLTDTPIPTAAPTATSTPTLVPSPTSVPTNTPTSVPRTPTRTVAPATATPSPVATAAAPTPLPLLYPYRTLLRSCTHSGGVYIKGTVTRGGAPVEGVRVRLGTGPHASSTIEGGEQFVRYQPDGTTGYAFTLKPIGAFDAPFTWYIWIADGTGAPISDPNFHFQTNNYPPSDPRACWLAVVDFVK